MPLLYETFHRGSQVLPRHPLCKCITVCKPIVRTHYLLHQTRHQNRDDITFIQSGATLTEGCMRFPTLSVLVSLWYELGTVRTESSSELIMASRRMYQMKYLFHCVLVFFSAFFHWRIIAGICQLATFELFLVGFQLKRGTMSLMIRIKPYSTYGSHTCCSWCFQQYTAPGVPARLRTYTV